MTEAWATDDDLLRARERFAADIPGWIQPVLHGIVTTSAAGEKRVEVASGLDHRLPAVVLATVLGHSTSTATYEVSREQLAAAVQLIAPAEAATHLPHPNMWAWRRVLTESPALIEAVFVRDLGDAVSSEAERLLRSSL